MSSAETREQILAAAAQRDEEKREADKKKPKKKPPVQWEFRTNIRGKDGRRASSAMIRSVSGQWDKARA